ncbi:BtrH N-terminal domain-containing protein [Clostridium akagii]|uniref:BtrH N-terminal domain-containing protein n=1 Tax=Clostridium akagii TaxID=91623 RepID=UPI000478BC57|nr:BtrH N-terminal domain-containing protein [Clostridium akagii]
MNNKNIDSDCRIESFCTLLQLEGLNINKYILFGLGEGLKTDIIEHKKKSIKYYSLVGRDMDVELRALEVLGVTFHVNINEEKGNILNGLIKRNIDNKKPVLVNLDRYYLEYLPIDRAHFGLHCVIICAYDDKNGMVDVIDPFVKEKQKIKYSILNQAMQVELEYFSPKGILITIGNINNKYLSKESIREAIVSNCKKILANSKLVIEKMERIFYNISLVNNQDYKKILISFQVDYICKLILELEPTGSMYRKLYSEYLLFSADELNLAEIKEQAVKLKKIGGRWKELAISCKNEKECNNKHHYFVYGFKDIIAEEKIIYKQILEYIN